MQGLGFKVQGLGFRVLYRRFPHVRPSEGLGFRAYRGQGNIIPV